MRSWELILNLDKLQITTTTKKKKNEVNLAVLSLSTLRFIVFVKKPRQN